MALFVPLFAMVLETWRVHTFPLIFLPISHAQKHVYLLVYKEPKRLKVGADHFAHRLLVKNIGRCFICQYFP